MVIHLELNILVVDMDITMVRHSHRIILANRIDHLELATGYLNNNK